MNLYECMWTGGWDYIYLVEDEFDMACQSAI